MSQDKMRIAPRNSPGYGLIMTFSLAGAVAMACSRESPKEPVSTPKIVDGRPVTAGDPAHRNTIALVKLDDPTRAIQCSGSIIGPRLILTAAHCLESHADLTKLGIMFTDDVAQGAPKIIPVKAGLAATKTLLSTLPGESAERVRTHLYPHFDVAWLSIVENIPGSYAPLPILPPNLIGKALVPGQKVHPSGFGQTGSSKPIADRTKRTVETKISAYHTSSHARGMVTLNSPGKGICYGDSGGPTHMQVDGRWYIMGVHNGLPPHNFPERGANCEAGVNLVTVPSHFANWIRDSSGVDLGANATLDSMKFGDSTANRNAGLEAACAAADNTFARWFTFQQILSEAKTNACSGISGALKGTKEFTLIAKGITDVSPIALLGGLETVNLVDNALIDLSSLQQLPNLRNLIAADNLVSDISTLKEMKSLESLHLGGNRLTRLDGLEALSKLTHLRLSQNSVSELKPIAGLSALRELNLDFNRITSLASLEGLDKLESLDVRGNPLSDFSSLAQMTSLKRLSLQQTGIVDLSIVASLSNLEELRLQENPELKDLAALRSLPSLKKVYLRGTGVPQDACGLPDRIVCNFRQ